MASTEFQVLTPERVSLQYDIAGIGSRGAACAIDTVLQTVLAALVLLGVSGSAVSVVSFVGRGSSVAGLFVVALVVLAIFAVMFGYFMLFEIIWSGQTPGKRVLGLRVIRENGYPVRPIDVTIRNLVRLLDGLPAFYAVGVLVMLFNGRSKRLGDFAAGTIVVREGARARFDAVPLLQSAGPSLRPEDATLVRDFLMRRNSMNPTARADLAARLASAVSTRYGVALVGDAEDFLERLGA